MNYKNLVFAALVGISCMSHAAEAPKTQSPRSNPLFAWSLGALTLKTAYHGVKYGIGNALLDSINNGHITLGSLGSHQASVTWKPYGNKTDDSDYAKEFRENTHDQQEAKLKKQVDHHKKMFKFSAFLTFTGGLAYLLPRATVSKTTARG